MQNGREQEASTAPTENTCIPAILTAGPLSGSREKACRCFLSDPPPFTASAVVAAVLVPVQWPEAVHRHHSH